MAPSRPAIPPSSLARVEALLATGAPRILLGLVGPPGAGKSTLAQQLQAAFAEVSQVLPMDGFHLANSELQRLGRAGRKGAPDTFDAAGYLALLQRLRQPPRDDSEVIYAPEFRRDIEEAVAGAIAIEPQVRLVITEGNYLLLDQAPWNAIAPLLDEAWYVEVDDRLREHRLAQRHEEFGRSRDDALAWVAQTDAPNARLIAASRPRATHLFRWDA
ncbi:nucleoside/nucleotide kinase family protein [Variovorax sp. LARHSF232]